MSITARPATAPTAWAARLPSLKGNPVVQTEDATSLIHIVLTGNTTPAVRAVSNITMPPFGWRLNDQQVADVVNFIRTSWGNSAKPVSASDVADVRKDRSMIRDEKEMGSAEVPDPSGREEVNRLARFLTHLLGEEGCSNWIVKNNNQSRSYRLWVNF